MLVYKWCEQTARSDQIRVKEGKKKGPKFKKRGAYIRRETKLPRLQQTWRMLNSKGKDVEMKNLGN